MSSAVDQRRQPHARIAAADIQRPDALGPIHLVRRERDQVQIRPIDIEGDFARGLNGVGMKQRVFFAADAADFLDRLHDADFVVGVHCRNQNGPFVDRVAQLVQVDQAGFVHREIDDLEALAFEPFAGVEHGLVLGANGDDAPAFLGVVGRDALQRQIVGFGGAGGPDDLPGIGADQRGDLLARLFDQGLGLPAECVRAAGGVAIRLGETRQHLRQNARIDRRRGVIVHINRAVHRHCLGSLLRVRRRGAAGDEARPHPRIDRRAMIGLSQARFKR
ncbi:MAG: hypothetical protein BWZ10_01951 [candidate division BRC1 bacterium ADurb.BinA364]|nr:MAG: hypothetical protein BWZ10_01951 [candidate division BRC1 bacterium ADurb.BinA364]